MTAMPWVWARIRLGLLQRHRAKLVITMAIVHDAVHRLIMKKRSRGT